VAGGAKRFSAKRKLAIVQRLLRGESLEVGMRRFRPIDFAIAAGLSTAFFAL
jgi:hypothetical protein